MAGRIRTIKPELLEDEKTAGLSDFEFRLFVSLLLLADDYGNLRAEPGFVRGQALWSTEHTPEETATAINELAEAGLIRLYDVRGQRYLSISGWAKHQKVDKPGRPRVPGPDDPEVSAPREWSTYFIRLGDDGPVKIGKTVDIKARLKKLQTTSPAPLRLLALVPFNVEAECHKRFSALRKHGEWFDATQELIDFINASNSRTSRESFATDLRPPISDLRPPTHDQRACARDDDKSEPTAESIDVPQEVKARLLQEFKNRGVVIPDTYFLPEAVRLVSAYVDATGRLVEDVVEAAFKAFDALAASWTVDRRTPKTFVGNWDAIQGVIGGQDPKPRQTQRLATGSAKGPALVSGRQRLAEDVLREKRTPPEERATEVPAEFLELKRKLEIVG